MDNSLISRQAAIELKSEFLNPNVNRETEEQTAIDRAYARGWNSCNTHWIDEISKLPSAQPEWLTDYSFEESCTDCPAYDTENHRCPRFNQVIRRALKDANLEPCEDCISRQAAIEAIDRYYKDKRYITRSRTILSAICRDMKSTMDSLPSAQPKQRWIPTSEKLPDELAEVNVTWENTEPEPYYDFVKGHCFTGTAVYFRGRWYWYSAVCVDYLREYGFSPNDEMDDAIKVLAWMPLPEPYKEDKDERD